MYMRKYETNNIVQKPFSAYSSINAPDTDAGGKANPVHKETF